MRSNGGRKERHKIIFNPNASWGAAAKLIPSLREKLEGLGLDYSLELTGARWHAVELARQAVLDGHDVLVAAGGDGTANEVLNGIMEARAAGGSPAVFGVLPVGRGNDFAYGVGVVGLEQALAVLARGERRPLDVGRVTGGAVSSGRFFGNGVGIGFDALAGLEAAKLRLVRGAAAYAVAALKLVATFSDAPLVRVRTGTEEIVERAAMVSVMNGPRAGGAFFMAPEAVNDDGILELCVARQTGRIAMLGLFLRFLRGTQAASSSIRFGRAADVAVEAPEGELVAHADGETICTSESSLRIECLHHAVDVIAPE